MKKFVFLCIVLTSCGPGAATKQFFDNACKNYKTDPKPQVEREKEEPKEESTPESSPTPPDYDNRCSEADKSQILADREASNLRRFAEMLQSSGREPSAAEIQVSFEDSTRRCDKLRACSGLPLEVVIPTGSKYYSCGMRNGQNWIEIGCDSPNSENQ